MTISLTPTLARRLFITKQRLAGDKPQSILDVVRDIGCLQIDPINAVARSHQIVLFSRLGNYDLGELDRLMWHERKLFEYWAHCASIVLTEDYPIFQRLMNEYPWSERTRAWTKENEKLRRYVLAHIRKRGPVLSRQFEEAGIDPKAWVSTGWTSGRNISRMIDILWIGGKIMVTGRDGIQKKWDLSERVLPDWTPREKLNEREVVRRAVQKSLRALGIATPTQINFHFTRGRYPNLQKVLNDLEQEKIISRVQIDGDDPTSRLYKGAWYIHNDDLPLLDDLQNGAWSPRTTLLSPFDNLICDRKRTESLFDFYYRIEIYVPEKKRQYGYYVLPILHGDQLIGRISPKMDREQNKLIVEAVYAEPNAPKSGKVVRQAIEELAVFLKADEIVYGKKMPSVWKRDLK
ncbi:MAG: crosslink repair DNA glycosylase YcaQ family protein [Chloroflexota bacterium]